MFLQPFVVYNFKSGAGIGGNSEITANWKANTTTAFLNLTVSGVTKFGKQTMQILVGPRIPVAAPSGAKPGFGWRAVLVFLFPR
jgi:hypothetical protein